MGRLQKVLRALPDDAQIYRTDAPPEMINFIMGFIRGEKVHEKLRLQLCMLVSWRGYTMFEVKSADVESWLVVPSDEDGTPVLSGRTGATRKNIVFIVVGPAEKVVRCVLSI